MKPEKIIKLNDVEIAFIETAVSVLHYARKKAGHEDALIFEALKAKLQAVKCRKKRRT